MKLKFALAAATLIAAQSASSATLQLEYSGSAAGYERVNLIEVPVDVAGDLTRVSAGGFAMNDMADGGLGDFIAWCLDLGAFLGTSGTHEYETTETPFGNGGVSLLAAGMQRIANVFNANFGDDITANSTNSAAFQLALWEVVYDSDFNIDTGAFNASSNADVEAAAAGYLDAAANYSGASLYDLTYLESTAPNRRQNLVTAELAPVPLPATGLMLMGAIGGIAAMKRRKKA